MEEVFVQSVESALVMNRSTGPMDVWRKIVWREYITRVRRRAFLVATLLGPVLWVGLVAGIVLLTQSTESPAKVWVVDHDGLGHQRMRRRTMGAHVRRAIRSASMLSYQFGRRAQDRSRGA